MNIVLKNANVISMVSEEVLNNTDILIENDRIISVRQNIDGDQVIDCSGKYIIPGLADMHVHIDEASMTDMKLFVANGITNVRNMRGSENALAMREKAKEKDLICPLIYTGTPILDGSPPVFPQNLVLETPEEARAYILKAKDEGYNFVKVYNNLTVSVYKEIIKTSKEAGLDVIGHIPVEVGAEMAIAEGQYCFEHVKALKKEFLAPAAKAGVYFTPTLIVQEVVDWIKKDLITEEMYNSEITKYVSKDTLDKWREAVKIFRHHDFRLDRTHEEYVADVKVFLDAGGMILAGTDTQLPFCIYGFSLHDELERLSRSGISNYEILKAATIIGAKCNHEEDEWGTIEPTKYANLVILKDNPLQNIENTRSIDAVVLKGNYYNRETLDGFLFEVAEGYKI